VQGEARYAGFLAYSQSKLANVLFTYALARRLQGTAMTANALHPGAVATGFGQNNQGLLSKLMFGAIQMFAMPVTQGAQTSIYLASSPAVAGVTGRYFSKSRAVASSPASQDEQAQERLWELSEQLTRVPVMAAS
jgi:NAD(P)-dependent dehydrogenase (short-subunit alcohol dehydrogenase family)